MDQNIETLCENCVHKSSMGNDATTFCKLLEKEMTQAVLECTDWEETSLDENTAYECDQSSKEVDQLDMLAYMMSLNDTF